MEFNLTKFLLSYEIPMRLRNNDFVLDVVKSLDEGREFIKKDTFKSFKPAIHTLKFDYGYIMARNLQRPIFEIWNFAWKQTFILGEVNPALNMQVFTATLIDKIF